MSSPDGTFGSSITDAQGRVWGLGAHGETGIHIDHGVGSRFCFTGGRVYVQGRDGNPNWYILEPGDHWRGPVPLPIPEPGPPPFERLPRLVTRGSFFATEAGERHTLIDASSFMSFKKFMEHDATVADHFEQLQALGFNTVRVFLMARNLFDLNPVHYPEFYDALPEFVIFAATFGLRSNLVVFPDCALVMPDTAMQRGHWLGVGGALQPVSDLCLVSLQNECSEAPNRINSAVFQPLPNLLCSRGSNGSRRPPERNPDGRSGWWAWEEYHTNETAEPQREPHAAMEFSQGDAEGKITPSHVPCHVSENKRPDKDGNLQHFHDLPACATLLCGGSCFHAIELRTSDLLTGYALECAKAWVAGARSVPLDCQAGGYRHRADLEGPADLRVYQRGSAEACIVRVRK